jgi:hypothetical protein
MAKPCIYTYKGKQYTYEELSAHLHDGELKTLADANVVQGDFVADIPKRKMPEQPAEGVT